MEFIRSVVRLTAEAQIRRDRVGVSGAAAVRYTRSRASVTRSREVVSSDELAVVKGSETSVSP